jgi:hypothetical protein
VSRPIVVDNVPDGELKAANTAVVVLNAYTTAMTFTRNERRAFDAALRAWRERNPMRLPNRDRLPSRPLFATRFRMPDPTGIGTRSPLTVFVAKPDGVSYGEAMSRVRVWLDSQKMQPAMFKLAPLGRVGFEIAFRSDDDVMRFQNGFGWPPA